MIFSWSRFFICLIAGGFFLIPLDIWYTGMRGAFVAVDPVTYSGVYMDYADAWIHWLPFFIVVAGLVGLWVDSRLRRPEDSVMI